MKKLWGFIALLGLATAFGMAGRGGTALCLTESWPHPVRTLRLTGGAQTTETINLAGAKNEYLFLPVLVEGEASSLKAEVKDLPEALAVECRFFRVMAAPSGSQGKFPPDALLPLEENFPGPASGPLPLWVSLKIPPGCPPGSYPLNLVFSDRRGSVWLPVELKVYGFALPEDLPITIFGGFWHHQKPWPRYGGRSPLSDPSVIKAYYQSLREYKINALGGSYPLPLTQVEQGRRLEDFTTYHDLLMYALNDAKFRHFQIPKLRGWKSISLPDDNFARRARVFYPLFVEYLHRQGWDHRALNYLVDEPRPEQYEAVIQAYTLAKSLAPKVRTLSAGWHPPPEFAGVIDIWAHQAAHYREKDREVGPRRGQDAWLYTNRLHGIDQPLAHPRLIGWLLYRYRFSGYLLWGVNYWPGDPWTTPPGPRDYYRKGTFYYPHPVTGRPVPTTRLETLRRGLQDFQYLMLLDQAVRRGQISREHQAAILTRVRRFTENLPLNPFPVSMAELEGLRLEIGELLDRAGA